MTKDEWVLSFLFLTWGVGIGIPWVRALWLWNFGRCKKHNRYWDHFGETTTIFYRCRQGCFGTFMWPFTGRKR